MSTGDLIVIAVISLMVIAAIASIWNNRRKGRSSCGCNCCGCPKAGSCKASNVTIEDAESCECRRKRF